MRTKRTLHAKVIQRERKRKADAEADAATAAQVPIGAGGIRLINQAV